MTDAHCHPRDLLEYLKDAEGERRETGTACAASSWNREEFEYHEGLACKAKAEGASPLFCCFALHPQLSGDRDFSFKGGLELLQSLAVQGRLDAVGETGFDLYDENFRAGEKAQDEIFPFHLEIALRYSLPMVLHVRRAMHKIFPFSKELKKLPAVVFHSWPGTRGEGEALIRRGINTYFSFGTVVLKNHKEAMASAALLPSGRILLETDAPYQPLRGKNFSSWQDLDAICRGIAALRKEAGSDCGDSGELEEITTANFYSVFSK
ncbi:MAG: TatD family hydrolase [Treponema sp.]|nr:TatD family hydrolase [Treponema sp.]